MEPVKGGMLANPPEQVQEAFKQANPNTSIASWAIKFAASLDGVITVLSGMSNIEQMEDNISYMKDFTKLSDDEEATIKKAQEIMNSIPIIPCTTCNYCAKVCPMKIGISGSFTAMNYLTLYNDMEAAKHQEDWLVSGHGLKKAEECIKSAVYNLKNGTPTKNGLGFWCHIAGLLGQRLWFYRKTQAYSDKIQINSDTCIKCGKCALVCPMNNLSLSKGKIVANGRCTLCYRCVNQCSEKAITILGKQVIFQHAVSDFH